MSRRGQPATDQAGVNPRLEVQVSAQLVALAYGRMRQSIILSVTVALLFVGLVMPHFEASTPQLLGWFVALIVVSIGRYILLKQFQQAGAADQADPKWRRRFFVACAFAGLSWSLGPLLLLTDSRPGATMILVVTLLSVCAVGAMSLSPLLGAMRLFLMTSMLPLAFALARPGEPAGLVTALAVVAALIALFRAGKDAHQGTARLVEAERAMAISRAETESMMAEIRRLAKVAELTTNAVFVQDADWRITWANQGFFEMSGMAASEVIGRRSLELIHLEEQDLAALQGFAMGDTRTGFTREMRCRANNGRGYFIRVDTHATLDASGRVSGFVNVITDLTEHAALSARLQENLALVDALFQNIPIPVVLKDVHGRYLRLNRAYADMFGLQVESLIGAHASTVIDPVAASRHAEVDRDIIAGAGPRTYELRQTLQGGKGFDALVSKVSVKGADGRISGLISTVVDISAQTAAAEAMRSAKENAEAANRSKTRFLANMSHELRTPLNAVIGAAQLLRMVGNDANRRESLVEAIHQGGANLLGLIESILDLTKIEVGQMRLEDQAFNLLDCVEAAIATTAVNARAKGLKLACIVDPKMGVWRRGDAARVRQLMLNLLGNAVKFTDRGEITLRVCPCESTGMIKFAISDTGIGINESEQARIFEPFRQGDDGANRKFGGSGLGLAIVREVVDAMGGTINVVSDPEKGSTFTFAIALPESQEITQAPQAFDARQVAFLEPHEASAESLVASLVRLGCVPTRCRDVKDLRQWAIEHGRESPDSWVLVAADADAAWELAEACIDEVDPSRVITMEDAAAYEADVARERFGLSRSLVKPILRSALVSRFGTIDRLAGELPAAPDTTQAASGRRQILVVEDDPLNASIVHGMLTYAGYAVTIATDGASALATIRDADFDVTLMDWQMPDMDGLEVTRRLRAGDAGEHGRTMPIVALTANAFAEDRVACLDAGMNDFLTKPVLSEHLIETVMRWCQGNAAAQAARLMDLADVIFTTPDEAKTCAFDRAVLEALPMVASGNDPGCIQRILSMYEINAAALLADIESAADAGDAKRLERSLHKLKSSSGQIGATALAQRASVMENHLRQGGASSPQWPGELRSEFASYSAARQDLAAFADETAEI
ncbi:MAG: ATP-binding protein [Burkholderiales bacterium]